MISTRLLTQPPMQTNTQSCVPFGGRALSAPVSISLGGMLFCDMSEEWRPIVGYEGLYEASSLGRLRSIDREVSYKHRWGGKTTMKLIGCILWLHTRKKDRRPIVTLSKNGILRTHTVHRLVCGAFYPNPFSLPEVNHLDGNPENNRSDNLEWCTHADNHNHAKRNGLLGYKAHFGEDNGFSKLTAMQVLEIRRKYRPRKVTVLMLAKEYGVSESAISNVLTNKRWKHLLCA